MNEAAEIRVAPDARWWPAVAQLVRDLGGAEVREGLRDLRRVVVLLPGMQLAPALRSALHAALGGQACLAPAMHTLESWTGAERFADAGQRVELFAALRASDWVRAGFGAQAGAFWSLARDLAALGDELTLAASGEADAFEGRWRAAVQRHFSRRAALAAEPQSQLVLAMWRASLAGTTGAAGLRARLEQRARTARGPLVWLVPQGAADWQRVYCRAYRAASGQPAILVEGDAAALLQAQPWLAAAWPELAAPPPAEGAAPEVEPMAARAQRLAASPQFDAGRPPLTILRCRSLEEEAAAAAGWTLARLSTGAQRIALVALDRMTARRVRALLDRAGVRLVDEAGWKLSTTSAAGALMRWLDLVTGDFAARDLLDWMHSPFTLGGAASRTDLLGQVRTALRDAGVVGGRQAVLGALSRAPQAARAVVQELSDLALRWQRPGTLGRAFGLLDASLDRLGMRAPLADDPVGRQVLETVEELRAQLAGSQLPVELGEFRALLAEHFEQTASEQPAGADPQGFVRGPDSPVLLTTLAGTRLRRFDAALLLGGDAEHLPGTRAAGGLLAGAVRRDLGLRTDVEREREQALDLAALLAVTPLVAATWRCLRQDEPLVLAPLLDRIAMVAGLAGAPSPVVAPQFQTHAVPAAVSALRAPAVRGFLPARLSASGCQELIDCPYRFFARQVLGLREAEEPRDRPDKRDFGSLLHEVLLAYHRGAPPGELEPAAERRGRLLEVIERCIGARLAQQPALFGIRERLRLLVPGYVAWETSSHGEGWRWLAGEAPAQRPLIADAQLPSVQLYGRIDRIDGVDEPGGAGERRILDYKTRSAAGLKKDQREAGEKIQLVFYALLLEPPPQQAAFLSLQRPPDPAAPEDKSVTLVPGPGALAEQAAVLEASLARTLARVAAGAPLPANGAESVCRYCEMRSLCRHGFTATGAAVSVADSVDGSASGTTEGP